MTPEPGRGVSLPTVYWGAFPAQIPPHFCLDIFKSCARHNSLIVRFLESNTLRGLNEVMVKKFVRENIRVQIAMAHDQSYQNNTSALNEVAIENARRINRRLI